MDNNDNGTGKLGGHRNDDPVVELRLIKKELKRLGLRV